ncbi:MAG: hypothetical protein IT162_07965 [Bryobacterales bacterium]|nr:hypothetical protein [Bryobacterales bacterium]
MPDDWGRSRHGPSDHAWYRIEFSLTAGQVGLKALYVPRVAMAAEPYVNGWALSTGARFEEPISHTWYHPQFHWMPAALLKPGRNVLHYRVRCYANFKSCGLSAVSIGAPEPLQARWRSQQFWQNTAPQGTTAITLVLFLSVLAARIFLGAERGFLYFGLATLGWATYVAMTLTAAPPLPMFRWAALMFAVLNFVLAALLWLTLLNTGKEKHWLNAAAGYYVAGSTVALVLASERVVFELGTFFYVVDVGLGIYLVRTLWVQAARAPSAENKLIVFSAAVTSLLGASDGLMLMDALSWPTPALGHFGVNLIFISAFWAMLGHALAGRRQALQEAQAVKTVTAERERIMRDMHDGIGSQLLAAKGLAERQAMQPRDFVQVLDECIDDLRLMIDSLDLPENDLQAVLGNLRYRMTERLQQLGAKLTWNILDLPPMAHLSSSDTLNLLRILQEAFGNALRHGQATDMVFTAMVREDGWVVLRLRDNGKGFDEGALPAAGRGLRNMKRRAASLGAVLEIETAPGKGCTVRLELPPAPASTATS